MKISNTIKSGVVVAFLSAGMLSASAQEISLNQDNYTVPSWTRLTRLMAEMQSASQPYSINMTLNGDPTTRMAFAWFTNSSVKTGKIGRASCRERV